MSKDILDFRQLPTSLVYAFDKPDDKIWVLNKLVNQRISEYTPMKQTKFTRPPNERDLHAINKRSSNL